MSRHSGCCLLETIGQAQQELAAALLKQGEVGVLNKVLQVQAGLPGGGYGLAQAETEGVALQAARGVVLQQWAVAGLVGSEQVLPSGLQALGGTDGVVQTQL